MDLNYKGKTALITGAGQGVGRRIAHVLSHEGAAIIVNDLFPERAEKVVNEIVVAGGRAVAAPGDITDLKTVLGFIELAKGKFGPIDILINNAGVVPERREANATSSIFVESDPASWRKVVELNVFGTMNCCYAVLPDMRSRRYGRIVSIMSEAGRMGEAYLAVYAGAKAAMLGFTKSIAREHGRDCITANLIALGAVAHEGIKAGPLHLDATPQNNERLGKMLGVYPLAKGLGRLSRPEDVADAAVFLASDNARYITGQVLGVSGGFAMP